MTANCEEKEKVAVIFDCTGYAASMPALTSLIDCLLESGLSLQIFTTSDVAEELSKRNDKRVNAFNIHVIRKPYGIYRLLPAHIFTSMMGLRLQGNAHYACMFGIDEAGTLLMLDYSRFVDSINLFYSFHIREKLPGKMWQTKRYSGPQLARSCDYILVQDKCRADLFNLHYDIERKKIKCCPNAPLGEPRRRKTSFFYDRLGIPADKKIALFAGSYNDGLGLDIIVSSIANWPEDWVFVLHTRYDLKKYGERAFGVRMLSHALPEGRFYLSKEVIPESEMQNATDSADVVFACYTYVEGDVNSQLNNQFIGHSSGKMAMALRSGIPIIANTYTNIPEIVRRHGCGEVIESSADIPAALSKIEAHYEEYSHGAINAFREEYDFKKAYDALRPLLSIDDIT